MVGWWEELCDLGQRAGQRSALMSLQLYKATPLADHYQERYQGGKYCTICMAVAPDAVRTFPILNPISTGCSSAICNGMVVVGLEFGRGRDMCVLALY